jgi:Phytanoyl-CoA dioxygenase (PhyH)
VRVSDEALARIDTEGFVIVPDFLAEDELAAAQAGLLKVYPDPAEYHDDPTRFASFSNSQFAGLRNFPCASWDVNRLAFHPDLVDAAERYFGTSELDLYKFEVWAKYSEAIDYDQKHHRDFGNHSLVVPKADGSDRQMTTFILLSDVTEDDAPTAVVPLRYCRDVPFIPVPRDPKFGYAPLDDSELRKVEVLVTGAAGTLFIYRTDVLHRGTAFRGERRSRFVTLADFKARGSRWTGRVAWPNQALSPYWVEAMERATVRERDLFGFPPPGDPYWDADTLRDVGLRYPGMDMAPYGP